MAPRVCSMFLIETPPGPGITTFQKYAEMLFEHYAYPHIKAGVKEVHILIDDPAQAESPKDIERSKRDETSLVLQTHSCEPFYDDLSVPTVEWSTDLLHCRTCKRKLSAMQCWP